MSEPIKLIKLSKEDREFLESRYWPMVWDRESRSYKDFAPPDGRQALLESFHVVNSGFFIGMDNHGVNIQVFVYRETKDGPLLGFLWGESSEEAFYDPDDYGSDAGPFLVEAAEVTATIYKRHDGEDFRS